MIDKKMIAVFHYDNGKCGSEPYRYEALKQEKWIPCSEKLPNKDGRYLVTYPLIRNKLWVDVLWYGKPTFPETDHSCFYVSDNEYGDVEYNDVVAWMPLPEPYGEREGE